MKEPKLYGAAPETMNESIIWAVDNAWFDSHGEHNVSLDDLLLHKIGKRGLSKAATLGELKQALEAGQLKNVVNGDSEYLYALVDLCIQNNLQLGLCNFSCFRDRFSLLNQPGAAILLDVNCPAGYTSDYPPDGYGVYLLHKVLGGTRPQADIFLVTGYPTLAQDLIRTKRYDPEWWPLSGIQIVDKTDERIKDSLEAFVQYFVQGLERDPFVKLARGLIDARLLGKSKTHPNTTEDLPEKVKGLPLAESFTRLEEVKETLGLSSFKALYHSRDYHEAESVFFGAVGAAGSAQGTQPSGDSGFPSGEDKIASASLVEHCNFLGVDLVAENCDELYLPIQPGLVFILYFCAFIKALERERPKVQLSCAESQNGRRGRLFVPLSDTGGLQAAVYGSEKMGGPTLWLKRTLTGRGEWVFELAKTHNVNHHIPWKCPQPVGRTFPLMVQPTFMKDGIELVWEWAKND